MTQTWKHEVVSCFLKCFFLKWANLQKMDRNQTKICRKKFVTNEYPGIFGIASLLRFPSQRIISHLFQLHVLHRRREFAATLQDHLQFNQVAFSWSPKKRKSRWPKMTQNDEKRYPNWIQTESKHIHMSWLSMTVRPGAGGRSFLPKGILAVQVSANAAALISTSSCWVSKSTASESPAFPDWSTLQLT